MVKMYGNKKAILVLKQVKSGFLLSLLSNLFKNLSTEEFRHHVFKVQKTTFLASQPCAPTVPHQIELVLPKSL